MMLHEIMNVTTSHCKNVALVDLAQGSHFVRAVASGLLNQTHQEEIDMSHVQHELADEFPDDHQILHNLKLNDAHFAKLSEAHHDLNREIHRIESGTSPGPQIPGKLQQRRKMMRRLKGKTDWRTMKSG